MHERSFVLLELSVLLPAIGAVWVKLTRDPVLARRRALLVSGLALLCAVLASLEFATSGSHGVAIWSSLLPRGLPRDLLAIDELSAPLLPLAALIYFLTILATLRTKVREFSFASSLASEALLLATLGCTRPWGIVALMAAGTVPPFLELRENRKPLRVYAIHMSLFVVLLISGQAARFWGGGSSSASLAGVLMTTAAVLLRSGAIPAHCWMTDLFEHATFGRALLVVTPMVGAYGVARLVLPEAPHGVLQVISLASLATAFYAAGMALVQREARRFFCYLFLSHSSLVLVGLETATPIGLTGALSLWLSVSIALTGFGLTLRCVESRMGRISLADYHGLYPHVPMLAALFLLTGLASIGFPGTSGFVGLEMLVEGVVAAQPLEGAGVVIVGALNGLAVMQAYFRIFMGKPHGTTIDLMNRPVERVAVLVLMPLILGGGLYPQPVVSALYPAAASLARSTTQDSSRGPVQSTAEGSR